MQWGNHSGTINDDDRVNILFPVIFPTSCSVSVTAYDTDNSGTKSFFIILGGDSPDGINLCKTGFRFCNTSNSVIGFYWFAIGY